MRQQGGTWEGGGGGLGYKQERGTPCTQTQAPQLLPIEHIVHLEPLDSTLHQTGFNLKVPLPAFHFSMCTAAGLRPFVASVFWYRNPPRASSGF